MGGNKIKKRQFRCPLRGVIDYFFCSQKLTNINIQKQFFRVCVVSFFKKNYNAKNHNKKNKIKNNNNND